ncbi:MAG: hypothetical protein CMF49_08885 [Legionellales bacterium]|nr:hypothetical protein [Legionellales bacterium]
MKRLNIHHLKDNNEFLECRLTDINAASLTLKKMVFEHCEFEKVNFADAILQHCKFIDCGFTDCNWSNVKLAYSSFNNVEFSQCKLVGINWTEATWPQITLSGLLKFYQCDLSLSSFFGLQLDEMMLQTCKLHDVDFRDSHLKYANFSGSDLLGSLFQSSHLEYADFCEAYNYHISPMKNNIKKAKFTLPDAINLLNDFEIEII